MGLTRPKYNNLDTSKFEIGDPITEINVNLADANPNNTDIGFIFKRGSTGDNVALLWDKSAQEFIFAVTSATGDDSGDITFSDYSNLQVKVLTSSNLVASGLVYPIADGTNGQVLTTNGTGTLSFQTATAVTTWGTIIGTLSNQTDLQTELDTKLDSNSGMDGGLY